MLKVLINCGPCETFVERCVDSLRSQSYRHWQAFVTVDPCGDRTFEKAIAARGRDQRVFLHRNQKRLYSMVNLISAVRRSQSRPEDVLVVLDGDDWFSTSDALSIIADAYRRTGCWMTYGSWLSDQTSDIGVHRGMWPAYAGGTTDFRNSTWLGTAVRTWKRWLWDLIDDRDFRDAWGDYFKVVEDRACMLPMLEMAGTARARHIPEVLMIYNRSTPYACGKTRHPEMLALSSITATTVLEGQIASASAAGCLLARSRKNILLKMIRDAKCSSAAFRSWPEAISARLETVPA
jgi:glycosyltransferase involved in cell wall biosynthesis